MTLLVGDLSPVKAILQEGHVSFDQFPEKSAYLFFNKWHQPNIYKAELVLRSKTPPGLCPINRLRREVVLMGLEKVIDVLCRNAFQVFR